MNPSFDSWHQFGRSKQDTGYEETTLEYLWIKYCGQTTIIKTPLDLYRILKYIHRYPTYRQVYDVLQISDFTFHQKYLPMFEYLSLALNEIQWEDRLSVWNHVPHFPYLVTSMWDTLPIYVLHPVNSLLRKALWNGKYGTTVYKYLLGIDFLGRIVCEDGLFLGTEYDGHLFFRNPHKHVFERWELGLGDGHFTICPQIITPFKKPHHGNLSFHQQLTNITIAHYRARIEHVNHRFNCHAVFHTEWRGSVTLLNQITKINSHISNVELHRFLAYPPYGPWNHTSCYQ